MIFYSDNPSRFQKVFFGLIFLIPFVLIGQERGEELYERNLEACEYIKSFQMNLSPSDPVYRERSQALRAEDRFNNLMELSYERQVDNWPNDEFELILEAFDIRKEADYNFEDQFFGDAAVGYDQASEIIEEVIDSADIKVRELLEEGELYLYEDEKPDWAESYFREALPYDPENRDILRGIKLIEGLLSFDDTKASLDDLISSNQFDRAAEEIEILKEVLPNELNQELREYEYLIEYKKEETEILAKLEDQYEVKIVTQNVDDLHERAGSMEVLHLHGELFKVRSTVESHLIYDWEGDLIKGDLCEEGHQLRPNIVWFGEAVPAIEEAAHICSSADILIIIGTSLEVYPAAGLIHYCHPEIPKYLIDPRIPSGIHLDNLTCISKSAKNGVPELVGKLLK